MATGYRNAMFKQGYLHLTDAIPHGHEDLGIALFDYSQEQDTNRTSIHWRRVVPWRENIFFSLGRHY